MLDQITPRGSGSSTSSNRSRRDLAMPDAPGDLQSLDDPAATSLDAEPDRGVERPLAAPDNGKIALPTRDAPVGAAPALVRAWFDDVAAAAMPEDDGTLAADRDSARAYRNRAKAHNTRAAYCSAVRA